MDLGRGGRALAKAAFLALSLASIPAVGSEEASTGIPVLIYHQIVTDGRKLGETAISLERFEAQMRYLAETGYRTLSMDQLIAIVAGRAPMPPRAIVLTFDDGWRSVLNAVPVLKRHRMRASFWIIAGKGIGGDYLDWNEIQALARHPRFEVQSHTMTHPWDPADNLVTWVEGSVPAKGFESARAELADSKSELERRLQRPVRYLAWPCGWYSEALMRIAVDAGYRALVTAADGLNTPRGDVLRIKRTFIDGSCGIDDFALTVADGRYRVCDKERRPTSGQARPLS
jgi:peptidoglycan/xylan/chitin deacetylase (PgdA/CDA1 family)